MAKRMKDDDGPNRQHNVGEIKTIIASAAGRIIKLNAEKAEIQAQITEVRGEVKGAGIKMADFNAALRLYELNAEDRNAALDNLRLCFEALQLGGQGSLFPDDLPAGAMQPGKKSRAGKALDAAAEHLGTA